MNDVDLRERVTAIAGDDPSPDFVASLRERLVGDTTGEVAEAAGVHMLSIVADRPTREERAMSSQKWRIGGVAAAVVAVLVVAGVVASRGDGGDGNQVASVEDRPDPTTADVDALPGASDAVGDEARIAFDGTAASAVSIARQFVDAYNAGDGDAVRSLFAPGITIIDTSSVSSVDRVDEFFEVLEWDAAQGTTLSPPACTITGSSDASATISCVSDQRNAVIQAVDGSPRTATFALAIGPEGIDELEISVDGSDETLAAFESWMTLNHKVEAQAAAPGNWTSIEEAREHGAVRARFATEWAMAISVEADELWELVDQYFAAYEAGDVDTIVNLFSDGVQYVSLTPDVDFEQFTEWQLAEGTEYRERTCAGKPFRAGYQVTCEYQNSSYLGRAVGADPVDIDLVVRKQSEDLALFAANVIGPDFSAVSYPFERWVASSSPADAGSVECCSWASVDDARASGQRRRELADEWAAFLEQNGCRFDEPCL